MRLELKGGLDCMSHATVESYIVKVQQINRSAGVETAAEHY